MGDWLRNIGVPVIVIVLMITLYGVWAYGGFR